jgi:L-asparaginase
LSIRIGFPVVAEIAVIALGGTIAMTSGVSGGVVPSLTADDLVAAVPGLADVARIRSSTFRQVPGAHLDLHDAVDLAGEVEHTLGSCDGVVVTQGTDTIEEMAFALDLLVRSPLPLVVTGAMRNPQLPGTDGPANLLAAVQTAAAPAAVGLGCVVVLNDEIHAARLVVKSHTARPDAFASPVGGPLGYVAEGRPRVLLRPVPAGVDLPGEVAPRPVALVTVVLGDDGSALRSAATRSEGVVVEAMGGGHVPAPVAEAIGEIAPTMPVVLASRTQAGEILRSTYGFPGSERDLLARGALSAGWLNARKARVLLALLLGAGPRADVAARLHGYLETATRRDPNPLGGEGPELESRRDG